MEEQPPNTTQHNLSKRQCHAQIFDNCCRISANRWRQIHHWITIHQNNALHFLSIASGEWSSKIGGDFLHNIAMSYTWHTCFGRYWLNNNTHHKSQNSLLNLHCCYCICEGGGGAVFFSNLSFEWASRRSIWTSLFYFNTECQCCIDEPSWVPTSVHCLFDHCTKMPSENAGRFGLCERYHLSCKAIAM